MEFETDSKFKGPSYGTCSCKMYEACSVEESSSQPLLFVWLQAYTEREALESGLAQMRLRLRCRTFFLIAKTPTGANGKEYLWACACTNKQNRDCIGFINGDVDISFMKDLCEAVHKLRGRIGASCMRLCGYGMSGFGVYQLAGYAPGLFAAAVVIAGYVGSTAERSASGLSAPQSMAEKRYRMFLDERLEHWSKLRLLLIVHARSDTMSSYADAHELYHTMKRHRQTMVISSTVFDGDAGADNGGEKRKKKHHGYVSTALLHDSSDDFVYCHLHQAFHPRAHGRSDIVKARATLTPTNSSEFAQRVIEDNLATQRNGSALSSFSSRKRSPFRRRNVRPQSNPHLLPIDGRIVNNGDIASSPSLAADQSSFHGHPKCNNAKRL